MEEFKMKWLCNVKNYAEAGMITGILENEGIPYRTYTFGGGARYRSDLLFGVEIQVLEQAYEQAKELLEAFFQATPENMDEITYE